MPSSHCDDASQHNGKQSTASKSTKSYGSKKPSVSSSNMMVVQARAKAEVAKARAAFADKEKELKIETARIQAILEAMQEEKEMNAAITEAEILEAGMLEKECESQENAPLLVPLDQQLQRTADYVHDQAHIQPIHQAAQSDDKDTTFYLLPVAASQHDQLYQASGGVSPQQLAAPRQQWHGVQPADHGSQLRSSQPVAYQPHYESPVPANQGAGDQLNYLVEPAYGGQQVSQRSPQECLQENTY
ncbi:uncharacterized protein LOC113070757 [Xyrichtys novacula]|uniref:Uncharacterized protein LOC113070757 n=1 Tax=Xyrichtys novacula TaxID=13765 RepID=A0AAV1EQC7_XYRNO|nr:uncharacterized protein LOC113070757 [Xyrichtys novacula]